MLFRKECKDNKAPLSSVEKKREERIRQVVEKSGMSYEEAKADMQDAKSNYGIKYGTYYKNEFWLVPKECRKEEAEKILGDLEEKKKKRKEIHARRVERIMKRADCSTEEAEIILSERKKSIPFNDFMKYKLYSIAPDMQEEMYSQKLEAAKVAEKKKKKRKAIHARRIERIIDRTDCSAEEAERIISERKKNIAFNDFMKYELYTVAPDMQEEMYSQGVEEEKTEQERKREDDIKKVMDATGWMREELMEKYLEARERTGCDPDEYSRYRFFEIDEELQNDLFLANHSMRIREKNDATKEIKRMLMNKDLTNECFEEYMKRPWCTNTKMTFDSFCKTFENTKKIIYKPNSGHMGFGIEAFELADGNIKEVYVALKKLPKGVVEGYVKQHSELNRLSPKSVNTIRIVSIYSEEHPITPDGKMLDIAYAGLRIGSGDSIVDNLHSGGMVAIIDIEKGELVTDAADHQWHVYSEHPTTGTKIKGFKVPYFEETIETVKEACKKYHMIGYLGWDWAITEDGPVLIEVNLGPGADVLTTPYLYENKGMKHMMEKYL